MKATTVWFIMAVVMIASQPSYAYGDLLFHTIVKKSMEDQRMPNVAPEVVPEVIAPVPTTSMPCTTGHAVAAARGELDQEDLEKMDASCGDHTTEVTTSITGPGLAVNVTSQTCQMWYPTSFSPGLGTATFTVGTPPEDYVPYKGGYAHKDCVPQ